MKITWLGQLGVAIESGGRMLMVDPYLVDTLNETVGPQFARMVPVDEGWLDARPDMVLLTHDHGDHLDMPSLQAVVKAEKPVEIIAGINGWNKVRNQLPGTHNYIMVQPGDEWTSGDFHIRAIAARHSDLTGVGYVITVEGKKIVISGDTLYFADAAKQIGEGTDIAIVVMNGKGNNMNCVDAARYARDLNAKVAIPVHWGLFEPFSDDPNWFKAEAQKRGINAYIAQLYETMDTDKLLGDVEVIANHKK